MPLLTRRQLLLAGGAATAVAFTGCRPPAGELRAESRVELAEDVLAAHDDWYATMCRGCGAGCGVVARVVEGRARKLEGNADHPVNQGKLCARGQASVQELYHPDRVRRPLRRHGDRQTGRLDGTTWDDALTELAARLRQLHQEGRGEVAILTEPLGGHRGQIVAALAAALGARWLAFDPLPELPLREAVRRVFGQERLPDFDIRNASFVLSFGADFLGTWISPVHHGVDYGVFRQGSYGPADFQPRAGRPRGHLVQVEPHFSTTAASADRWVPVRPGAEGLVALAMVQVILAEGLADPANRAPFGEPELWDPYAPERVAAAVGVPADRIRALARAFAARQPSLALAGGLAGGHRHGTVAVAAGLALNWLVGAVGRPGGVRPNPPPPLPGLSPPRPAAGLDEWRRLVEDLNAGRVSTVLVAGANPVHGLPAGLGLEESLRRAETIVSFSGFLDDTTRLADLVLPSHGPLEDWGDDAPEPGPGFPVWSLQQPVVRPRFDTRGLADVLLVLAEELGPDARRALPWRTFEEMLRASADRLFERGGGPVQAASPAEFWTRLLQRGGWWDEGAAASAPPAAPDLRWLAQEGRQIEPPEPPAAFPYHLVAFPHNTLRAGEGAHLPWLQAAPDPTTTVVWRTWLEVNPRLADEVGLREGDLVALESSAGRVEVPVYVHPAAPPGLLALPFGQGHVGYGRWASDRGVNPFDLLGPAGDAATGGPTHAAALARLTRTGRRTQLAKLEGGVPARQLEEEPVVEVAEEDR